MDWGQSQILVTPVPFLNVDATKLIKIGKSLITLGKKRKGQSRLIEAIDPFLSCYTGEKKGAVLLQPLLL